MRPSMVARYPDEIRLLVYQPVTVIVRPVGRYFGRAGIDSCIEIVTIAEDAVIGVFSDTSLRGIGEPE